MSTPVSSSVPQGGSSLRVSDPNAGARLLDQAPPPGYRAEWTELLAKPPKRAEITTASAMVFRIGIEWLALPAGWIGGVAPVRAIHSLPHRKGRVLDGLVNVRGELLPCFALERALGIERTPGVSAGRRLVIAGVGGRRLVFHADEVFGVVRYDEARRLAAPGRLVLVKHLLEWNGRTVGLLEPDTILATLEGSLA